MEETAFFTHRHMVANRLLSYGFIKAESEYRYTKKIMDGQFLLSVIVSADGKVNTRLVDTVSDEEYVLHRVQGAVGSFTGAVKAAYEGVLLDIAEKCFEKEVFRGIQTKELISLVRDKYGDEPEYLWQKFPSNAVWRRKDTAKWYGALLTVAACKLGFDSDGDIEVLDLRIRPEELESALKNKNYLPGYHMNKKSWYTICLNKSVPTAEICRRIDESYRLAVK